ncbi:glycosyl hydrolase family 18 protein [Patescibacteria group bacterium]
MSFVKIKTAMMASVSMVLVLGILFSINYYLNRQNPNLVILSPISDSFSILSFTKKRDPPKKIVYGYLPYWTLERAKYLQYDRLTDIAYFGLHIDAKGDFISVQNGEYVPGYNHWKNSEDLKRIIAEAKLHGVNVSPTIISHVDEVSDQFLDCRECWDNLANNIIKELDSHELTDVNLNFEYAEYTPIEKAQQYTQFVDFLNKKLDKEYGNSTVVVATFADSIVKDRVSDIEGLSKAADLLFIMAYDFHRPTSDTAGPVAPLGGKGVHAEYDIETMIKDYRSFTPPNKIIMGVPYYGYNWVVEEDAKYAARISGTDEIGYSQSQTYEYIMETIIKVKPDIKWDNLAKSPYFTYTSPETGSIREVFYDDVDSLRLKYEMINNLDLAGVGIWALGYDGGYEELWNLIGERFVEDN